MQARRRWDQLGACAERSRAWAEGFAVNVTPYYLSPPTSLLPRALWARSPLTFSKLTLLCAGVRTLARPRRLGDPDTGAGGRPRNADSDSHPSGPTNQLSPLRCRVIPCSSCSRGPSLALVIGAAAASRTQRTELQHIQGQRHTRASAVVVRVDEHRAPCAHLGGRVQHPRKPACGIGLCCKL